MPISILNEIILLEGLWALIRILTRSNIYSTLGFAYLLSFTLTPGMLRKTFRSFWMASVSMLIQCNKWQIEEQKQCRKDSVQFSSVQSLSLVRLFVTPWITARQASLSITNSRSSLRLISIKSVMPSSHLILCRPLLLLPPIPPSIRVFSNESALRIRWPKYRSFSFSIIPSKEIPGLISFRMDWLDLLAIQYLKSFPFCSPYLP